MPIPLLSLAILTLLNLIRSLLPIGGTAYAPTIHEFQFTPEIIAPGDPFTATLAITGDVEHARLSLDTRPYTALVSPIPAEFDDRTFTLTGKFPPVRVPPSLEHQTGIVTVRVYDALGRYAYATRTVTIQPNHDPTIVSVVLDDGESFAAGRPVTLYIQALEPTETPVDYQFTDGGVVLSPWQSSPVFDWSTSENTHVGKHTLFYEIRNRFDKEADHEAEVYGFRQPVPPPTIE